jgi:hypothetical protein
MAATFIRVHVPRFRPMAKSKFFRVAVEGATTDGRTMERVWIQDIAATYNQATSGARIFAEHIRGITPDSPFRAYGDVTAVKSEVITDGDLVGRLALYAQIEPTDAMVALVKSGQKIYPSIEVNPSFAGSGRAYLAGLGITDSPASLGVDILTFAAQHPATNPFAGRKQAPENLFSAATEAVAIEFEEEPADTSSATLFAAVREKLAKIGLKFKTNDGQLADVGMALQSISDTLEQFAQRDTAITQTFADHVATITTRLDAIEAARTADREQFTALRTQLEVTSTTPLRPASSGGATGQQTNC